MTPAKIDHKHLQWLANAGSAASIVPIARFVGPSTFALKGGGYGRLLSLQGIDEEGLTDQELEFRVRGIESSLRGLPAGSCLYQYVRVMSGFDLPRQGTYSSAATEGFVRDRLAFLKETAAFRRIDLFWCLTMEPGTANPFQRKPKEQADENSRMLTDLEKTATILLSNLGNTIGLQQLDKNETFQFFSYLFNLEEWAGDDQLRHDPGVDRQIVKTPVGFQDDQLRIGKRHIQMFSLMTTPESSRPCLFSGLLGLDCDTVVCSTWRPKSTSAARKEVENQEKFTSFFKVGVANRLMGGRDFASLDKTAGGRAADKGVDDLSDVIRALDKKAHGEYSLTVILGTSPGKYQVLWRVHGFDFGQQEAMLKQLAIAFGGDPACTDRNRVLRLPGFHNRKYVPAHAVTVEYPCDALWSRGDFRLDMEVLSPRPKMSVIRTAKQTHSEQDWAWVLAELTSGQDANETTRTLASRRSDKPNPLYYAQRTVDVASARLWLTKGTSIEDVIAELEDRRRLEIPVALCSARAREIAATAQRMIRRK